MKRVLLIISLISCNFFSCSDPEIVDLSKINPSDLSYKLEVSKNFGDSVEMVVFEDLDSDGVDEIITLSYSKEGGYRVNAVDSQGNVIGEHPFGKGGINVYSMVSKPFLFVDLDKNGQKELIISYIQNDTTRLQIINENFDGQLVDFPVYHKSNLAQNHELDYSVMVKPQFLHDYDGNGSLDLYCTFLVNREWSPRGIFVYDLETQQEIQSFPMQKNPDALKQYDSRTIWFEDLRGDGYPLIIPTIYYANDNPINEQGLKSDSSYLYILDQNLNLVYQKFYGSKFSFVYTFPIQTPKGTGLLVAHSSNQSNSSDNPRLEILNPNNFDEIWYSYTFNGHLTLENGVGIVVEDLNQDGTVEIIVCIRPGIMQVFNSSLEMQFQEKFYQPIVPIGAIDLDGDNNPEIICGYGKQLIILNQNLHVLAVLDGIKLHSVQFARTDVAHTMKIIAVNENDEFIILTYSKKTFVFAKNLIIGLFSFVLLGFLTITIRRVYRLKSDLRKTELEHERILAWSSMAQRITHSIKSPLNTIGLTAQRLQMQYQNDKVVNQNKYDTYLNSIIHETERLHQITKGFMNFVDVEKPAKSEIDLVKFFKVYKNEKLDQLPSGIHIKIDMGKNIPLLFADSELLKTALQNIVENAVDAMEGKGSLTIRASLESLNSDQNSLKNANSRVCIEISDTGKGVPSEQQSKIFKPYFSTKHNGSGMGLIIVKKILEDHGGEIDFKSQEGIGTTIYLYLPTGN